ncbi:hypothetical protein BsWGS_08211 [Bradybaena similaris]
MRFRLKRTLQVIAVCACVLVYINFFLANKSGWSSLALEIGFREVDKNQQSAGLGTSARTISQSPSVYPSEEYYADDRILTQLKFVPKSVEGGLKEGTVKHRKILLYNGLSGWGVKRGQETFVENKCTVPHCELTDSHSDLARADVVLFQGTSASREPRPQNQKWLLYLLESPYHTPGLSALTGLVNWTATYRHDSTIVAPYEKFVPFNSSVLTKPQNRNYADGKTKKVAWFVSNCGARNGRRQYANELAKYIEIDIYGGCGQLKCPRFEANKCFEMLNRDYKFYLSFENSNCRDYITEKFFINGLKHDVIPIVMGAAPEDYERAAPPHSYIHVDDFESPKELADYLHKLDKNDDLYNEYFQWKGTGDIINTFFWCRLCALAHDEDRGLSWYNDVNAWWRGGDICIGQDNWRTKKRTSKLIADLPVVLPSNH